MFTVLSSQISENIDIDSFARAFNGELLYSDRMELFYEVDTEVYVSIFRYGVVCFFNYDGVRINEFIRLISDHCNYFDDSELTKKYNINPKADELKFGIKTANLAYFDIDTLRVIMLNVAQSVALDYYFQKARVLLDQTNYHTQFMEKSGKLKMTDKELKKFFGKTHNLKNHIVENLHFFDSLPEFQQNDYLLKVDSAMKEALYLEKRFDNIYKELDIIREHLEYFSNLMNHGTSMKLEWIIIALLGVFVANIIIENLFG